MDHVIVNVVRHVVREVCCPVRKPFARKRRGWLRAQKRRQRDDRQKCNESFHLLSLLLYRLDRHRAARIRVHSQKISILRLLTLALSSNPPSPSSGAVGNEEREIELNFVRDRAHRPIFLILSLLKGRGLR